MATSYSPSIVRSNLIMYYDMNNTQKSWLGAPTTNYYKYSATFDDFQYSNRTIITDYLPDGTYSSCIINTFDQLSGARFFIDFTANSNGLYTCSYWAKLVSGSTIVNTTLNVKDFQTDVVRGTSGTITLTSSWQRISATGTTAGATAGLRFEINVNTSGATAKIQIYGGQVEQLSFASPLVPTSGAIASRSTTQSIVDLTGNNTITATQLTYAANNTFSFNGGTDSAYIGNTMQIPNNSFTVSAWVNSSAVSGAQNILSMNGPYFMRITGSTVRFNVLAGGAWLFQQGTTVLSNNTWYYLTMVYDYAASTWTGYINNVLEFSVAKSGTLGVTSFYGYIGYTPQGGEQAAFNGTIGTIQVYNRALSANEVTQNFNALRGRYRI